MTATKISKYANATLHDMAHVVAAAEDLYAIMAEFPDDPGAWQNELDWFDSALEECPGTNANYHKKHSVRESKIIWSERNERR